MTTCTVTNCENSLCIYSKDKKCVLNSIVINDLGYCDAFTLVNLPEEIVEQHKRHQRK